MDGAVLRIAEIETDDLEKFRAAKHPVVIRNDMDFEANEDYIVPVDKIVSSLGLDALVGESRGKMNNISERRRAVDRVNEAIALHLTKMDE